ncbi:MAG: hypothetical protein C0467_16135 [Planctomycetaceae bacterium]|nr:hypothetical protein [Planctomycetaceae bacterium]
MSGTPNADDLGEVQSDTLPPLPPSWCWAELSEIAEIEGGITKGQNRLAGSTTREIPYLRVANVQRGFLDLNEMKTIPADEQIICDLQLQVGDVLFTEGGDRDKLGRGWVWNGELSECIHQNHIFRARPNTSVILPKFVSHHGNLFGQDWFSRNGKQTTNLASINKRVLRRFPVPVPPLAEQERILARLDELLSDLDAGVSALQRARANLKKYRAAVLKAAVTGELTTDWRAAHPNAEPATKLLDRILTERRRKWEADQLAKFAANGKTPPKGWQEKYPKPVEPKTDSLQILPQGWCWATIEQLTELVTKGTSPSWQGYDYTTNGVPFLRSQNVRWGELDLNELAYLPEKFNQTHPLSIIRTGDVLLNLVGASVGRAALASESLNGANLNQAVAIIRLFKDSMIPRLLVQILLSPLLQLHISATKVDVARANFNLDDVRPTPIPLPPKDEQGVLCSEVEYQLSLIVATENYIAASLKRATRLRQSILKEAFAGRLVPQDPKDEPASVLLERIRQSRTASTAGARPNRPTRPRRKQETHSADSEDADGTA